MQFFSLLFRSWVGSVLLETAKKKKAGECLPPISKFELFSRLRTGAITHHPPDDRAKLLSSSRRNADLSDAAEGLVQPGLLPDPGKGAPRKHRAHSQALSACRRLACLYYANFRRNVKGI